MRYWRRLAKWYLCILEEMMTTCGEEMNEGKDVLNELIDEVEHSLVGREREDFLLHIRCSLLWIVILAQLVGIYISHCSRGENNCYSCVSLMVYSMY